MNQTNDFSSVVSYSITSIFLIGWHVTFSLFSAAIFVRVIQLSGGPINEYVLASLCMLASIFTLYGMSQRIISYIITGGLFTCCWIILMGMFTSLAILTVFYISYLYLLYSKADTVFSEYMERYRRLFNEYHM